MNILLPTKIMADMIGADTNIPAVDTDAGEVAWADSGTYAIDDLRVDGDGVYSCVKAHTAASAAPRPAADPVHWLYKHPTNRMAPFDEYLYTQAKRADEIKYVLTPGFFTGFAMYGMQADAIDVTLLNQHGGQVLVHEARDMWEQAYGEWEYLFGSLRNETHYVKDGLPLRPASELQLRLRRNTPGESAQLGMLAVGQWTKLFAPQSSTVGGAEYGAEARPKSYSYFKRNEDGTYTRRQGRQAKVITVSVAIDAQQAPMAEALLRRILDVPVAVEVSHLPRYGYLSTFGFVTGTVTAHSPGFSRVDITVEGNV